MADILVVEDNIEMGTLLCDFLNAEGYTTEHCTDGADAMDMFVSSGAKMVILDIMLPHLDGFGICRKIRETSNTPIIMVSAKNMKDDKLKGLLLGADDYIEKPYDIDILIAKVKGVFSRRYSTDAFSDGFLKIDKLKRTVKVNNGNAEAAQKELELTQKEYELLSFFIKNKGIALSREKILNSVWDYDYFGDERTIDTHVKKLRSKLGNKAGDMIKTIWGMGYKMEE